MSFRILRAYELRKMALTIFVNEFDQIETLAEEIRAQLKLEDFVLIKCSRSMRMEKVWERLKALFLKYFFTVHTALN